MTIFRKAVRSLLKKIYYYICCKNKVITIEPTICVSCREYLLNMSDDTSSLSEYDYNQIYLDNAKSDSF